MSTIINKLNRNPSRTLAFYGEIWEMTNSKGHVDRCDISTFIATKPRYWHICVFAAEVASI